jgi:hypothetical protein
MKIDYNKLNSFLHLCYLPEASTDLLKPIIEDIDLFREQKKWQRNLSTDKLIKEGCKILNEIFRDTIPDDEAEHILPLSGGLDSRVILAYLIKVGLKKNITAVTYGVPGTYDFDIGKIVADFAGVKHMAFNLDLVEVKRKNLIYTCETGGAWTHLPHSYYNRLAVENCGTEPYYWSGYLGGVVTGGHYKQGYEFINWNDAKSLFWNLNRREKKLNIDLTDTQFDNSSVLPDKPFIEDAKLVSYPEQLDLCIRQNGFIKKQVVKYAPKVNIPFAHPAWIKFMLASPPEARLNCELYKSILKSLFPDLFSLPTKHLKGKSLFEHKKPIRRSYIVNSFAKIKDLLKPGYRKAKNNLNYIDGSQAYRKREDYISLANESISFLSKKNVIPWLNPISLWKQHCNGTLDIPYAIATLISLEVSLWFSSQEYKSL